MEECEKYREEIIEETLRLARLIDALYGHGPAISVINSNVALLMANHEKVVASADKTVRVSESSKSEGVMFFKNGFMDTRAFGFNPVVTGTTKKGENIITFYPLPLS